MTYIIEAVKWLLVGSAGGLVLYEGIWRIQVRSRR